MKDTNLIDFKPRTAEQTQGNVALSRLDAWQIEHKKRKIEKKKQLEISIEEERRLKHERKMNERIRLAEKRQDEFRQKQQEQQQELDNLKIELKSIKVNIEKAESMSIRDYFETQSKIKKTATNRNLKDGKKFRQLSVAFSSVSAFVSVLGLVGDILNKNPWYLTLSIAFVFFFLSLGVNRVLGKLPDYHINFFDKEDKQSKFTFVLAIVFVFSNCVLSICTNYLFYRTLNMLFVATLGFSFLLDFGAIVTTLVSYDCLNLRYKKSIKEAYENKLEQIKEENQENANENVDKNVDGKKSENALNTNIPTVEEPKKSGTKKPQKTGRKATSRAQKNRLTKSIESLEKNVVITPKKVGFENEKDVYYLLIEELAAEQENIQKYTDKNGKNKYKKI